MKKSNILTLTLISTSTLHAADKYWDRGAATGNWTTASNWDTTSPGGGANPSTAPGASDTAIFNVTALTTAQTITMDRNISVGGMVFRNTSATAVNTDGALDRTMTIGTSGITINSGAGAVTFGSTATRQKVSFILGGAQTWQNNSSNTLALNANNTINNNGNLFTVGGSGDTTAGGIISGAGGLTKADGGNLTLSAANTYSGATTISGGKIILNSAGTINNSSGVSLGTSGTFDVTAKTTGYSVRSLTGSGSVLGSLTVTTTLAAGNSAGTITVSGNFTMAATSSYGYELTGGGTDADLTDVGGSLTLTSGAALDLIQLGTFTEGNKFTLFAYDGSLSGTFSGLAENAWFNDAGGWWKINYQDTTAGLNGGIGSKYVTVTAVPEPSTILLSGLCMLGLLRRRR